MASTLPTAADLGSVDVGLAQRPVGTIDAQPLARAYERLGAGLNQLGGGLADAAESKSRYDFALAQGGFTSDMIGLDEATRRDLNYGPDENGNDLSQRYTSAATAITNKWAGSIGSGPMRDRFTQTVAPQIARGQADADTRSFGLYRDHQVAATDVLGENLGNGAVATDDPATHAQAMDSYGNAVDALAQRGFITPDQAVAKKRTFGAALASGLLLQQSQTDPLGALNHVRAVPGSDDELTERFIQVESGGNANAKSGTSSASGLGQFEPDTWLPLIKQMHPELAQGHSDADLLALRADPNLSREATKALIGQNRSALQTAGLDPTAGNLYLSHFLGAGGASAVLKADPNTPVASLLPPKVIAANQSVLGGRTAGSVAQWANNQMGGYAPGEGSIYSFIPPQQRAVLETKFYGDLLKKDADDTAEFKQRYQDSVAEAFNTGAPTSPLSQGDFIRAYGGDRGLDAYKDYQGQLQLGADRKSVAQLSLDEQQTLYNSYTPAPGSDGYADAIKRQEILGKAIQQSHDDLFGSGKTPADPAGYAVRNLPASNDAWSKFSGVLADPTASDDDKRAAARTFASITDADQRRVGVAPDDVRIVPQSYVTSFNKQVSDAATSDNPQARVGLIDRVQKEKAMWGDAWPQVMRQIAPSTQPIVRAIGAGMDPTAASRLLSLDPKEKPEDIIKQQTAVKSADLTKSVDDATAPLRATLLPAQVDQDFPGYYNLTNKLSALYVRDGMDKDAAASKAFGDVIGGQYDFKDSYRIPKSAGVNPDTVQAGALAARTQLGALGAAAPAATLPGATPEGDLADVGRDGKWVTSYDNSGLMLSYNGKFVRDSAGAPFVLGWSKLSQLGGSQHPMLPNPSGAGTRREYLARHGIDGAPAATVQPPGPPAG